MADRIIVNSGWSRECLVRESIPAEKISVIPLAYELPSGARVFQRTMPEQFTNERPLRLLYLGQVTYLKGILPLLEAMEQLREAPVELTVVGPELCAIPANLRTLLNARWVGPVARGATTEFYQRADAFVFPSFCDGFGLTQLEAQAWQLPVIASRHCGEVVTEGVNGVRLPEVSGSAIAEVVRKFLATPELLRQYATRSTTGEAFTLATVGRSLVSLLDSPCA